QFGAVSSAQVLSDRETGRSRGFGFVEMVNDDEALSAIESLDGQDHDGRRLTVNEARPRTPGGGGGGGGGYRGGGGGGFCGGGWLRRLLTRLHWSQPGSCVSGLGSRAVETRIRSPAHPFERWLARSGTSGPRAHLSGPRVAPRKSGSFRLVAGRRTALAGPGA